MIIAPYYCGKRVGVFGLARSGIAVVQSLMSSGADVWAWDDDPIKCKSVGDAAENLYEADFMDLDYLVIAPGVPFTHPVPHELVLKARKAGVPIIGDMDIFENARREFQNHHVVAVTGTNGKSTTSALIAYIIAQSGRPVALGGNIGTGVLALEPLDEGGVYVLEVSSYQIDLMGKFCADIAVLLNISPDHLDRHGDMEGYVNSKGHLFELQDLSGTAICSFDDEYCLSLMRKVKAKLTPFSLQVALTHGFSFGEGRVVFKDGRYHKFVDYAENWPTLKGDHNAQNVLAASATCLSLGLEIDEVQMGLRSFPGLEHRQEHVATINDVLYVNDSKATNVEAASKALSSFKNIHWIAGGRMKDDSLEGLYDNLKNVKAVYLIGESMDKFAQELESKVPYELSGEMSTAVASASSSAEPRDVVLLSPACASFDQYSDFELRGNAFRECLLKIEKFHESEEVA